MTTRQFSPASTPQQDGPWGPHTDAELRRAQEAGRPRALPPSRATRGPEWLEVVRRWSWLVIHGRAGDPSGGLVATVTECRERATGARFLVRENVAGRGDFTTGSGLRMGLKDGRAQGGAAGLHEVLDLWTEDPAAWARLAELVAATDPLGRPVHAHRELAPAWCERRTGWGRNILEELEVNP